MLEVADGFTESGRANLRRGTRATVVPLASNPMTVRVLSNNPRRTNGAAAGIAIGTAVTFTGILWYCIIEGCLN